MTVDRQTAQDDLAFIRRLLSPDDDGAATRGFGRVYALWGLCFALPLFPEWARLAGYIELPELYWPIAALVVTLVATIGTIAFARKSKPIVGTQSKATTAVFGGVGWANVAVLLGLILVSVRMQDGRIMMVHALVVFAFQGAAWYAVWALKRQMFPLMVSIGYFAWAILLGATIPTHWFVLAAAIGLLVLMVLPGLLMMRFPKGR